MGDEKSRGEKREGKGWSGGVEGRKIKKRKIEGNFAHFLHIQVKCKNMTMQCMQTQTYYVYETTPFSI